MHGFFDVVVGSVLGALIAWLQLTFGPVFDVWISTGPIDNILLVTLITLILVRIHPEPADNCPCFDDSVAFSGVFIGVQVACYQFSSSPYSISDPMPSTIPFSIASLGLPLTILRIVLGVVIVFSWRALAKPTLLRVLPPIFRVVASLGLLLPRKFFLGVEEYSQVPTLRKDDNVIPPASEIPGMIAGMRHPRKRAISVGPQSEADAYEVMAFRERRRRESQGRDSVSPPRLPAIKDAREYANGAAQNGGPHEQAIPFPQEATGGGEDEDEDDEALFQKLLRPRVRYDVEVVTKLIVYAGIAWISLEVNPHLFVWLGLAPRK